MANDAQMPELLPCPFCGENAKIISGGPGNHFIQCQRCAASTDDGSQERAVECWNRRADLCASGQVQALVDRLQRLDHLCATAERKGPSHDGYVTDATYNHWCGQRAAIHDILAALTPAPQPATATVKPLEWQSRATDYWRADTTIGRYSVAHEDDGFGVWLAGSEDDEYPAHVFANSEAAKIAAQADYERRILAALSPAATEPVAWMQRHKLGPHHLCNPDTQAYDDWSDPFPVYTHSSPVTVEAADHDLLQRAVDLIRGDLVGSEWKKACNDFVRDALRVLAGEKRDG